MFRRTARSPKTSASRSSNSGQPDESWCRLYDTGATPYVLCVNVNAVIAALLLVLLWKDCKAGALSERDLETAAFSVFLYDRMIGAAAEIDDHLNRGRNMGTRTSEAACSFVM